MTRWLALIALVLATLWSSVVVIDEREIAIVTQFGEYKRALARPGLQFKTPFIQDVMRMDSRIQLNDASPTEYLTLDKKRLLADPITRWRIAEPLKFYTTVHDESGASARLQDVVNSELRRELATREFDAIIGSERESMMQQVASNARTKCKDFGIHIVDVRIKRADLPNEVEESVFGRMRAERDRVAKQYRSEGEGEAAKIRAETDKERTILLAKAYETSQKIRGEGDAQSTTIYAKAYDKNPEFYAFLRSLDAYEKLMSEKSTLVISTGSDLFKYLRKPEGTAGP
ncbi:MAG TPA: protease modulator HflC [Polyangiaceae bacterium]|nr:protease modulator HflC [Polyangiaceae bacterium]